MRHTKKAIRILACAALGLGGACSKGPLISPTAQNGANTASLALSDGTTFDFGPQFIESKNDHTFTLTNSGTVAATAIKSQLFVSVFSFKGGNGFHGQGGTCGDTLAAGASCTLVVTYYASYQSDLSETLKVTYNDGATSQSLTGPMLHGKAIYSTTGTLDTTFGTTGVINTRVGTGTDFGRAIAIQSDGKLVVAGSTQNAGNFDFALVRYNSDSSLDNTFGTSGISVAPISASGDDVVTNMLLQNDGKFLVVGNAPVGGFTGFALARFNADGTLDTSFGSVGKTVVNVGTGDAFAAAVAMQADHKILVAGYTVNSSNHSFALVRFNADGSLDTTFGLGGVSNPVVGSDDYGRTLMIQPDGKILMGGVTIAGSSDFALIRLNANGSFDTSFGSSGKVTTDIGLGTDDRLWAMTMQSDGRIILAGSSNNGGGKTFALARYTGTGALDTGFGTSGRMLVTVGAGDAEANGVVVQNDGKIDLVGYTTAGGEKDFAAARVSATGVIDASFGLNGRAVFSFGPGQNVAYGAVLQQNGKLVMAGQTDNGSNLDFGLVRVWP